MTPAATDDDIVSNPTNGDMSGTRGGGSRPVPDPTALTDRAIEKALAQMQQYVDGQLSIRDERLSGIDRATELRMGSVTDVPNQIAEKVNHLSSLTDEKFRSIDIQFRERDTRSERESRDNKVAVDAAFAAQKEAAAKQDEANAKAIDKSEKATAETIKTNQELSRATTDGLTKNFDDLKERVGRIESLKAGATENKLQSTESRTGLYATIGIAITIALFGMAIITFLATSKP